MPDEFESRYVRLLAERGRDVEGRPIGAGTPVVAHPVAPDEFMQDTPETRATFVEKGYAWTLATLERVIAQAISQDHELEDVLDNAQGAKQEFVGNIDANLAGAKGQPFPESHVSLWSYVLPWQPEITSVVSLGTLTETVLHGTCKELCVPVQVERAGVFAASITKTNEVRIYGVRGGRGLWVHVVSGFVTPLTYLSGGRIGVKAPDAAVVEVLRDSYLAWAKARPPRGRHPQYTYFTLGSLLHGDSQTMGSRSGRDCVLYSYYHRGGEWAPGNPPSTSEPPSVQDFIDRLLPETADRRTSKIKALIDTQIGEQWGSVTVNKVARATGYLPRAVRNALLRLQREGPYHLYMAGRELAVRAAVPGERADITENTFERGWLRSHAWSMLSMALGVGARALKGIFMGVGIHAYDLVLVGAVVYVANLIGLAVKQRALDDRERAS